jgi:iron complex transport system substrate-binding protein
MPSYPERIVCLSTETVETLYLLGEEDRIAGISGFTVRPERARREKPKVSGFSSAKIERILAVKPDLALCFSDLQAGIAAELARAGVEVHVFNQRDIDGILRMIVTVGSLVGAQAKAERLARDLERRVLAARERSARRDRRPRVYFEEWDDPHICGIRWVSQLIDAAGGEDVFAERAHSPLARERILASEDIVRAAPDIVVGSWCGKKFRPESVAARPGWDGVPAVREGRLHEVKSALILSAGPAALSDGLDALVGIIQG